MFGAGLFHVVALYLLYDFFQDGFVEGDVDAFACNATFVGIV